MIPIEGNSTREATLGAPIRRRRSVSDTAKNEPVPSRAPGWRWLSIACTWVSPIQGDEPNCMLQSLEAGSCLLHHRAPKEGALPLGIESIVIGLLDEALSSGLFARVVLTEEDERLECFRPVLLAATIVVVLGVAILQGEAVGAAPTTISGLLKEAANNRLFTRGVLLLEGGHSNGLRPRLAWLSPLETTVSLPGVLTEHGGAVPVVLTGTPIGTNAERLGVLAPQEPAKCCCTW